MEVQKFIKLTGLTDRNGQQCRVIINTDKVLGVEEKYGEKFGGGVAKDSFGYPKSFTLITTKGKTFEVIESVEDVLDLIYQ